MIPCGCPRFCLNGKKRLTRSVECFLSVARRSFLSPGGMAGQWVQSAPPTIKPSMPNGGTCDCMIGFFEYIEDEQVFLALLDTARTWAQLHGLNALYGPFNLDYEDSYGVLVEGRDRPPVLLCGHTPPYYQIFMEKHGFEPARSENLAFEISVQEETPALRHLAALAARARLRGNILVRPADFSRWEQEGEHVLSLLNISLAHLPDFIPWQRDALMEMLASFRAIADPDLVLFAEVGEKVVGFFPGLPNINEALIHADGLRHWWDYVHLWWYMRRRPACLSIKSVLVHPDYWGTGVAVLLFDETVRRVRARGYRWLDLSLTSADNPKTPMLAERMGARVYKRYRVYRLCL